jgi:hypothetical protein
VADFDGEVDKATRIAGGTSTGLCELRGEVENCADWCTRTTGGRDGQLGVRRESSVGGTAGMVIVRETQGEKIQGSCYHGCGIARTSCSRLQQHRRTSVIFSTSRRRIR